MKKLISRLRSGVGRRRILLMTLVALGTASASAADDAVPGADKRGDAAFHQFQARMREARVPLPPAKVGCYAFAKGQWQRRECLSKEYVKQHIAKPGFERTIESEPHKILAGGPSFPFGAVTLPPTPIILSDVSVNLTDPAVSWEKDSKGYANTFSVQNNTNVFDCLTCGAAGQPFPAVPGVANSASQPGDQGWVQFVFATGAAPTDPASICVWNVDVTIARNTSNAAGYDALCNAMHPYSALTGSGALPGQGVEVWGYATCVDDCILAAVALTAQISGIEFVATVANDELGLYGHWTAVSGTILGRGKGSEAIFRNVRVDQNLDAYTCIANAPTQGQLNNQDPVDGLTSPQACPSPIPSTSNLLTEIIGKAATTSVTAEYNNLINGPDRFECSAYHCHLFYSSIAR